MTISREDVEKVAKLSKLQFSDAEKEKFRIQLDQIITYVQKLNELDTENVEPTYYVQHSEDMLREDKVDKSLSREKVLENAPDQSHGFFRVPKVINK
jgi:aspartyl-tRNA(Asn)/glutamyl-tRNA(Gln) amidotransferase subunit C